MAYLYNRAGNAWTLPWVLTAVNAAAGDGFGAAVAVSSDGNTVLIGAKNRAVAGKSGAGLAYVFLPAAASVLPPSTAPTPTPLPTATSTP